MSTDRPHERASPPERAGENALAAHDLDELLERYWAPVVRYATQIIGTLDEAEDVAQEAFLALWERRRLWREDSRVAPLLFQIARNRALMARRRARVRQKHSKQAVKLHGTDSASPLEWAQATELHSAILRAVENLPSRQRQIFRLSRVQGLSHADIAAMLGLSQQTVANHLTVALRRLRNAVSAHLGGHVARPALEIRKESGGQ